MTRTRTSLRALGALALVVSAMLAAPGSAMACSQDDTAWFESFLDSSCLNTLTNTELDPLGGLRLTTSGTPVNAAWDTEDDFTSPENGPSTLGFPRVGVSTLAIDATAFPDADPDDPAGLELPATSLPLTRDAGADSVLHPTAPGDQSPVSALDNDSVADPAVVRAGSTYVMFYAARSEDGGPVQIFRATSADGVAWTRYDGADPDSHADAVLQPSMPSVDDPDPFDEHGVSAPEVVYEASDAAAPYKMWYSGRGDVFGAIGYATSTDGITWTKVDAEPTVEDGGDPDTDPDPDPQLDPALDHGRPGAPDAFVATDPSVIKDGGTWKMWYTGDDSDIKRVAYATAPEPEGPWTKGGTVVDAAGGNFEFGAFGPTVWKDGSTYRMIAVGRKEVGSNTGDFQTKIISTSSSDGIAWPSSSIELNPAGPGNFDSDNLSSPDVLVDPGSAVSSRAYKLYYTGQESDTGPFRIGLAGSSSGNSFSRVAGAAGLSSVLNLGTLGTRFDSRSASGVSAVKVAGANPEFVGVYSGVRSSDSVPRLGLVNSALGSEWTKVDGAQAGTAALFPDGGANDFNEDGVADPSLLYDSGTYRAYFTGNEDGVLSIGHSSSVEDVTTKQPTTWTDPGSGANAPSIFGPSGVGGSYDETAVSDPYVVKEGTDYVLYYTARSAAGVTSIGRAVSTTSATSGFTRDGAAVLTPVTGTFEDDGIRDPVVWQEGATWHMLYTGIERFDEDGDGVTDATFTRTGHATTNDPSSGTWTRDASPFVLGPSQQGFASDENGAEAQGALVDGTTTHVWYSGVRGARRRGMHATYDTAAAPPMVVPNGWATYQFGDNSSGARDFQQIVRDSIGDVELWMSVLQPYSPKAGDDFWSDYFPVAIDVDDTEELDLLLTIQGVRWQARMKDPSSSPTLDKVQIAHAPVEFAAAGGSARTSPIEGPAGQDITTWREASVDTKLYGTGSASGTLRVLNATSNAQLASAPITVGTNTNPSTTTVDLSGISVVANPALRLVFELDTPAAPSNTASPLITSAKVLYFTNLSQPPPPPPPPPVAPPPPPPVDLTLTTTTPTVVFGQKATLSGTAKQAGAPVPAFAVGLLEQPLAAPAFTPLPGATTDAGGNFTSLVTPQKKTTYKATGASVSGEPTVTVAVNHSLTLRVLRRRGRGTFTGRLGPTHSRRLVTIERRIGRRWVRFARVRTSSRSSFRIAKKLSMRTKYQFRARTAGDADHGPGLSKVALVDAHKVSLTARARGRTVSFVGRVAPNHRGKTVLLKQKRGTRFVTIAKLKLSSRSTFALKRRFGAGVHEFRADMPADRLHFLGSSPVRTVTIR